MRTGVLPLEVSDLGAFERLVGELLAAARRHEPGRPPDAQGLEDLDVPIAGWIDALELPPRVRALARLWCAACASAAPEDASMLEFLRWISAAGHSVWAHLEAAVLGWRLPAGTAALSSAIAGELRGELRLETPVVALSQDAEGVVAATAGGEALHARRAVVTVPVGALEGIAFAPELDAVKQRAARENHAGQGIKAWVLARDVAPDFCAFGAGTALDFAGAMDVTPDGVLLVCFGPSSALLDVNDHAAVGAALRALAPDAEVVGVHAHDWVADPWSRGTWAVMRPGQVHAAWSALRAPQGRIHFAGAHTALRWPSFMDGAIESGARVAAEVMGS